VISTIYNGYVGVAPGTAITGSYDPQGTAAGDVNLVSLLANDFAETALNNHAAMMTLSTPANSLGVAVELAGRASFSPGIYSAATAMNLASGPITLDAGGNSDAEFIFIAGTTLVTAADTEIFLDGGARAENVMWVMGTAATLGARSVVQGSILAGTAITFGTESELYGCAIAQSAVTFESAGTVYLP
jgi:hypothetical protein